MSKTYSIEGVIEKTSDHLHRLLPILNIRPDVPEFNCGTLVVAKDIPDDHPVLLIMVPIGKVPENDLPNYMQHTLVKVSALDKCRELVSSHRVRDIFSGRLTGAIHAGGHILAFSGLKGRYDALLMSIVAIDLGLLSERAALRNLVIPNDVLRTYREYRKIWKKHSRKKRTRA